MLKQFLEKKKPINFFGVDGRIELLISYLRNKRFYQLSYL